MIGRLAGRAFRQFDQWIERAIMGELPPCQRSALNAVLAMALAVTMGMQFLPYDTSALMIVPLAALCFFHGWRMMLWLVPALALVHLTSKSLLECALFAFTAGVSALWAAVTVEKYRLTRRHEMAMREDLEIARRVQQGLEPPRAFRSGPLDMACFLETHQEVGGDFLRITPLSEGRVQVLMGDVMGKGVRAALAAAYTVGLYDELTREELPPDQVVSRLNRLLCATFEDLFVTLVCLEADLQQRRWRYCRAGHPPPLVRRRDGATVVLEGEGLAAGIDPEAAYQATCLPARPGDQVLLATDGLLEETVSPGFLAALLGELEPLATQRALQELVGRLSASSGKRGRDDATAALLRWT